MTYQPKILSSEPNFASRCYGVIEDAVPQIDDLRSLVVVRAFDPLFGDTAILFNPARMYRPHSPHVPTGPWTRPREFVDAISRANMAQRVWDKGRVRKFADIVLDNIPYFFTHNDFPVVPNSGMIVVDRQDDFQEHSVLLMLHALRLARHLSGDIILYNDKRLGASQRRRHYHLFRPMQKPFRDEAVVNPFTLRYLNLMEEYQLLRRNVQTDVLFQGDPFALLLIRSGSVSDVIHAYSAFVGAWTDFDPQRHGVDFVVRWDEPTQKYHVLLDARLRGPVSEFKFGHASIADKLGIVCVERPTVQLHLYSDPHVLYRSVMDSMRIPAEVSGLLRARISDTLSEIF